MGAYSSLATLGLNLALSQAAQRSRSDQLGKQEDQQASDILASDAATRQQQAADLAQRMAAERARLGAAGVGTTGGSADAVLSGLQDQGDLAQQALDAQTTSRLDQVQQSSTSGSAATCSTSATSGSARLQPARPAGPSLLD